MGFRLQKRIRTLPGVAAEFRVDPIVAVARFNLRHRMTKPGLFIPVEPFTAPSPV